MLVMNAAASDQNFPNGDCPVRSCVRFAGFQAPAIPFYAGEGRDPFTQTGGEMHPVQFFS